MADESKHTPAVFGGDLPDSQQQALEEGHDTNTPRDDTRDDTRDEISEKLTKDDDGIVSERDLEAGETVPPAAEAPQDPNIVDWDGPDDPLKPMNWSSKKKWANVSMLSFITLITPLASSMFAPAVPQVLKEFHTDSDLIATWVVSVYVLGFAAGPLLAAPLSEMYGRVVVYNGFNVLFFLFTLACALAQNMDQLIVFRFFAGCFGIAPITNGGGTIADIIQQDKRGVAMSFWSIGPLLGPVIGPVCGSFLAQAKGWRWIFWLLTIFSGADVIACFLILRETYAPVLLERKAKRLRKETGNPNLRAAGSLNISVATFWKQSFLRPAKLMTLSFICASMSFYMACVYGMLYLFFTTFTFVFEGNYNFSSSTVGLVYIGLGIGMFIGLGILGATSDRIAKHLANKHNGGKLKPEYRLPILLYGGPFIPIGLFLYGWTAEYHIQWAVPILGTLLFGVGLIAAFMCIITYLVDAFEIYAASAIAANTILRSIFGAVFPLFGLKLYNGLGLGWGNSLLGFLSVGLCFVPVLFWRYGERIRKNPKFAVKL